MATHPFLNMTVQVSPEAQEAVASFAAAGNDPDSLSAAIDKAAFLDKIPGEERQKLRGACKTRLVEPSGPAAQVQIASLLQLPGQSSRNFEWKKKRRKLPLLPSRRPIGHRT